MERKSANVEAGFTQAERVKEPDRSREAESGTVILSSMPSKNKALPTLPAVHTGPFIRVPVLPLPEESETVVPLPSSNFQYATSPDPPLEFANQALASELGSRPLLKAFAFTRVLADRTNGAVYRWDD
jgi:hypothetical protein